MDVELRHAGASGAAPTISPGDVLDLAESDYKFGAGGLTLRVGDVMHTQRMTDGLWLYVRGIRLDHAGNPRDQRQVLVRMAALPSAIRDPHRL